MQCAGQALRGRRWRHAPLACCARRIASYPQPRDYPSGGQGTGSSWSTQHLAGGQDSQGSAHRAPLAAAVAVATAAAAAGTYGLAGPPAACREEKELPIYTRAQVAEHCTKEKGIWCTYKDGVYDITNFIMDHPGGDRIMLAAGKSIEPFWRLYQMHVSRGNATKILDTLIIGKLDPKDVEIVNASAEGDPYGKDPKDRHPALLYHSNKPCNAELPPGLLMDNWITPNDLFFIRHHHPVPHVDSKKFRLDIEGLGTKSLRLDLEDIRSRFLPHEVTTTIQCGGNRRGEFNKLEETSGISWGSGAMSTATFKGALLRDVLTFSGLMTPASAERDGVQHVIFEGMDSMQASIPIEKALSQYGDVLLAYEMNGEPLPPEHGYPIRVIVPGHVGVRQVKWVTKVKTSAEEAEGPWQRGISYKGMSPSVKTIKHLTEEELRKVQSIQEQPVTSMILEPKEMSAAELDDITVKGFAWSGGGRGIIRVDVTADGGRTWHTANLKEGSEQHPSRAWAWTFWEIDIPKPEGLPDGAEIEICAKAIDASYNQQPERVESIWNIRGVNNNAWPRVRVKNVE